MIDILIVLVCAANLLLGKSDGLSIFLCWVNNCTVVLTDFSDKLGSSKCSGYNTRTVYEIVSSSFLAFSILHPKDFEVQLGLHNCSSLLQAL